jgi:hypothetical protein
VFAIERRDSGGQVFIRFNNPDTPGVETRGRKSLGLVVRDARAGRLDPRLLRAAELAVQHFQARLLVAESPTHPKIEAQPNAGRSAALPYAPTSTALTIRAGFDVALDTERGKYGSNRTRRYDQMLEYQERLFGGPRHAVPLLDAKLTWDAFVPAEARALWRRMADRHVASKGAEFGVRAAEGVVDAIYSVAAWLREQQLIPPDVARAPAQWRRALKEEWAQRTGNRRSRPRRPRHTVHEYRRIFAAIDDPRVDPRIRLAIELAAECRTGQVLRCTRRMLVLPAVAPNEFEAAPPGSLGQIEIPGAGKKHGEVVVLTPEQRRAVDDALAGYLANWEAASRDPRCACSTRAGAGGRGRFDRT